MRTAFVVLLTASVPITNCDLTGLIPRFPVCTMEFVYGLTVELTDEETGEPIEGATLSLLEGERFIETMEPFPTGNYVGAGERAGTYTLIVEAEGYEEVIIEDIFVDEDECHVIPVRLHIEMTPTESASE